MINRFLIAAFLLAAPVGAAGTDFAAGDYRAESQDSVALDYRTVMLQEMLRKAETQRRDYKFSDAVRTCEEAMSLAAEPQQQRLVAEALALARNGDSMTDYCSTPKVVARKLLSLSDFYLYYPLEPASWRPLPEGLAAALGIAGDPLAGTAEAARPAGAPRVFVVGGGGSGIPVYRMLRRKGVPIASSGEGYFYAATEPEGRATIAHMTHRISGIAAAIRGLTQALEEFDTAQMRLPLEHIRSPTGDAAPPEEGDPP